MTEIAWAAGFYDGEGCTGLLRKGSAIGVRMGISQKDRRVLDRFAAAVGVGRVYEHKGVVPFHWQANKYADVVRVFDLLRPWLSEVKREQAEQAFATATFHDGERGEFDVTHAGHRVSVQRSGARARRRCLTCYNAKYGRGVAA